MTRYERLEEWALTLDENTLRSTLVKCVDELIDAETIGFYPTTKVPYWDGNGENIDGSETLEDEKDLF